MPRKKTSFDKYFDRRMKDPAFASAYGEARAVIDSTDALIRYTFPGTQYSAGKTINVTWYDGDQRPPREIMDLIGAPKVPGQGFIFLGEKGVMLLPHVGAPVLLPGAQFRDYPAKSSPPATPPSSKRSWQRQTSTPFDYSGPLPKPYCLSPSPRASPTRRSNGMRAS